jgi:integrase
MKIKWLGDKRHRMSEHGEHTQSHIDLIAKQEHEFLSQRSTSEWIGDRVASFAGSIYFVLLHAMLTGARDGAIASMKLKHVDLTANSVTQDAREVKTKFSKTFTTFFFPVSEEIREIVAEWVLYLGREKLWGDDDPLFPATQVAPGPDHQFAVSGLQRAHWSSASPIRTIFREAFERAGLPYFNPHSFRSTLVRLGEDSCKTPEQFKAWSQNLGRERVLTTFLSYGEVSRDRQGELIRQLATLQPAAQSGVNAFVKAMLKELRHSGVDIQVR